MQLPNRHRRQAGHPMTTLINLLCCFYALVAICYGVAGNSFADFLRHMRGPLPAAGLLHFV
jgi:hypothetical protein